MDNETLRRLQLVEAGMLADVTRVCDENNIRYFLSAGTLIGAVRHQGFIPWDDDIDMTMPYSEYVRFLEIAQEKLGDRYFVQTFETDPAYSNNYCRIRLLGTTMMKPEHSAVRMNQSIWLDIFPLIGTNKGFDFKFKKMLVRSASMFQRDGFLKDYKQYGLTYYILKLFYKIPLEKRIRMHKKLTVWLGEAKGKKYVSEMWKTLSFQYPKELIEGERRKVPFEGKEYYSYPQYEQMLTIQYGDYMQLPPVEKRVNHGDNIILDFENSCERYYTD